MSSKIVVILLLTCVLNTCAFAQASFSADLTSAAYDPEAGTQQQTGGILSGMLPGAMGAAAGGLLGFKLGGMMGALIGGVGGFLAGQFVGGNVLGLSSDDSQASAPGNDPIAQYGGTAQADPTPVTAGDASEAGFQPAAPSSTDYRAALKTCQDALGASPGRPSSQALASYRRLVTGR